jgi:MYXO-CTERM domain-containing protein
VFNFPDGGTDDGPSDDGGTFFGDDGVGGCGCGVVPASPLPWGVAVGFGLLLARRRRRE